MPIVCRVGMIDRGCHLKSGLKAWNIWARSSRYLQVQSRRQLKARARRRRQETCACRHKAKGKTLHVETPRGFAVRLKVTAFGTASPWRKMAHLWAPEVTDW
jgi:hypothetical protein